MVTFEELVASAGDRGPYQVFVVLVSSLTICMHTFGLTLEVFTALTPTCLLSPSSTGLHCLGECTLDRVCHLKAPCNWTYEHQHYSIISEFNLICGDQYKANVVTSLAFLGYIAGSLFWGWMGDKFGRVPIIHTCQFLNAVMLFLTAYSPTYYWYGVLRMFTGFTACHWNTACVYAAEWGGRQNRSFTLVAHIVYSSLAFALFGTFAYFVRPWRDLVTCLSIFGLVSFLLMLPCLRESPRWLYCNNQKEQAVKNIQFAAKFNKIKPLEVNNIKDLAEDGLVTEKQSLKLLLKTKRIFFITLTFFATTTTNVLLYYMLKFSSENISSSPYMSCWLLAASDLPSAAIVHYCTRFSRRKVNFANQVLAIVFCYLCCFREIRLPSALLCMAFAAVSFNFVYLYLAEVYPTSMRNRVTALCIALGEVGGMVANPLVYTGTYYEMLPYAICATISIPATIGSWWLPETCSTELPDYFSDTVKIIYPEEEVPINLGIDLEEEEEEGL